MHPLQSISLTQFRNYTQQTFEVDTAVVAISGNNGIGKTNLLDAIYYLCFTKSYFQNKEINNVQRGKDGFRIEGTFGKGTEKSKTVIGWREGKKKIEENDILVEKITDYIGTHTALMIAPDDIELINGSGTQRRKFFDGLLAQADGKYLEQLLQYQKVLQQRNAYLKQGAYPLDFSLIDVYDQQLAISGAYLIERRIECSTVFPEMVERFYGEIAQHEENIGIYYESSIAVPAQLLELFRYNRAKDIEAKRTTAGPHLEDWRLELDLLPYRSHASQGQKKSLLVSMKLAQLEWLRNLGKTPLILLDDIFEKLDQHRIWQLFSILKSLEVTQIFMTHTGDLDMLRALEPHFKQVKSIQL